MANAYDLARAAGVDVDTYSLARTIASEHGSCRPCPDLEQIGVGWAVINEARRLDMSITARVTFEKGVGPTYEFGPQNVAGRWASTREAPNAGHIQLAIDLLAGRYEDPTQGAQRFFEPALQDRLVAEGYPGYRRDAEEILEKWGSEGWAPTVQIEDTLFLRKGGRVIDEDDDSAIATPAAATLVRRASASAAAFSFAGAAIALYMAVR